jgi:hydrogenase maturation protease
MSFKRITILGVGNLLMSDDGFGVRVVHQLERTYCFPEHVTLVDGNVLGLGLLGIINDADHLIVIDAIRNKGKPGDRHRLTGDEIPKRLRAKNSLHEVDLLEALTLVQALDHEPDIVIVGVEPKNIDTLAVELTPEVEAQIDPVIEMVLEELNRLGVTYKKEVSSHVSCNTFENRSNQ